MIDDSIALPGAPVPWEPSREPPVRPGPPFLMTEMIVAEPALAGRLVRRRGAPGAATDALAQAIDDASARGEPVVVIGCGTSEHAAMAFAEIANDALANKGLAAEVRSEQAFEAALAPPARGLLVAISHEGGTAMTNLALERARSQGVRTALVTVSDGSPGARLADIVVATGEQDQSWCHTVGYLSPMIAAAVVAGRITGAAPDAVAVQALVAAGADDGAAIEDIARSLAGRRPILVTATGADRAAGRELVLKIEEGTHVPAAYRDLETILHGHLAGTDADTALVLVLGDSRELEARVARARGVLRAAEAIGMSALAILNASAAAAIPSSLTPGGRIVVPDGGGLARPVAALLGTAVPLQLVVERLARARGVNPDAIGREDARYRAAAEAADAPE